MTTAASKGSGPQVRKTAGISGTLRGWFSWLTTHVPSSIRKGVSDAFNTMRKKVVKLYSGKEEEEDQWYDARENLSDRDEQWHDANPAEDLTPVLFKKAVKGMARKYVITPAGTYEPVQFLNAAGPSITSLLDEMRGRRARNVRMRLVCKMLQSNKNTGEDEVKHAGFPTENWKLYGSESAGGVWNKMREKMLESFSMCQKYGSGWRVGRVVRLEINIGMFVPLDGSGHKPLPKKIADKKAIINMVNSDNQCFRWAFTRALNPTGRDAGRVTKELIRQSAELDWSGVEFPTSIDGKSINTFENNNGVNIEFSMSIMRFP